MRFESNSRINLANNAHNPQLFMELVDYFDRSLNSKGQLFSPNPTNPMTMVGYHLVDYKNTCYDGKWPLLSIAPQSNNISIYAMIFENDDYLVPNLQQYFGKSNCGKSCIRIKSMTPLKYQGLDIIIKHLKQNQIEE